VIRKRGRRINTSATRKERQPAHTSVNQKGASLTLPLTRAETMARNAQSASTPDSTQAENRKSRDF
jgi:hypothetical protein